MNGNDILNYSNFSRTDSDCDLFLAMFTAVVTEFVIRKYDLWCIVANDDTRRDIAVLDCDGTGNLITDDRFLHCDRLSSCFEICSLRYKNVLEIAFVWAISVVETDFGCLAIQLIAISSPVSTWVSIINVLPIAIYVLLYLNIAYSCIFLLASIKSQNVSWSWEYCWFIDTILSKKRVFYRKLLWSLQHIWFTSSRRDTHAYSHRKRSCFIEIISLERSCQCCFTFTLDIERISINRHDRWVCALVRDILITLRSSFSNIFFGIYKNTCSSSQCEWFITHFEASKIVAPKDGLYFLLGYLNCDGASSTKPFIRFCSSGSNGSGSCFERS